MLQVIVVALLFGFGTIVAGKKGEVFGNFVESANNVSIAVMSFIIKLSPIGVFCLITPVVAANGPRYWAAWPLCFWWLISGTYSMPHWCIR